MVGTAKTRRWWRHTAVLLPLFTIGCMLCLLGWAPASADAGNVVVTIRFSEAALDTA
jgi:hypothetical protein